MKSKLAATLFTLVLTCFCTLPARADLIWYEGFPYADGPITNNSGGLWIRHSGSGGAGTAFVKDHKLEIAASSPGVLARADDIHRDLTSFTNTQTILFASFTVGCTNLPPAVGTYIAHFYVNSSTFHGRVFAQAGTLPGTWRLGIAGAANTVNQIFPVNLATNTDYQVVVQWDPTGFNAATLWVNPNSSSDLSFTTSDSVTTPAASTAYGFRQAGTFGSAFFYVTNLAVATTFDEAATNVWSAAAFPPTIVQQLKSVTNFVGAPVRLSLIASGLGLGTFNYQWVKDDVAFDNPEGNSTVYSIANLAAGDVGNYYVIVSNTATSLSVTSQVASIAIDTTPIPPFFTQQAASTNVYPGQTATFSVQVAGPQPITTLWYRNNAPLSDDATFTGTATTTLTVANVQTNNGTAGTYKCIASNVNGNSNSANATLTVVLPLATNILYIRSLVDPTFFLPTNTSIYWTATGVATAHTNLTGNPNASFIIQDATAAIGVFMAGGASQLPAAGDSITVSGPLGNFNGALQFALNASDPSTYFVTNSTGNALPAPVVLPFSFTNGIGYGGVSNIFRRYMSSLVTLTNVYFSDGPGTYASGQITEVITNSGGAVLRLFFNAAVSPTVTGQPIPEFAWSVTAPLSTFLSPGETNRSGGFQLLPTRYEDIVTSAPVAVTGTVALAGNQRLITWTAQPFTSYSILTSTNVVGPYVRLVSGVSFNTTTGQYTDTNAVSSTRFYRIVSP